MSREKLRAVADEYLETTLRLEPVLATLLGLHDYDTELGDASLGARRRRVEWLREQQERLEGEVREDSLDPYERIDFLFLRSHMRGELLRWDEEREAERNPILYPDNCLLGLFLLFTREHAPLEERVEPLIKRLERTAPYLEAARETVSRSSALHAEIAAEVADSAARFLEDLERDLVVRLPDHRERIGSAVRTAAGAFADYAVWARETLAPRAGEPFALGRAAFDARLREEHRLPYDAESLEKMGWELLRSTQSEMDRVAESIAPGRGWRALIADAKRETPTAENLLEVYRACVERARRFVIDKRLVPLPEGEELELVETPAYERSRVPYAAYMAPGPFDAIQKGVFFVTPVDPEAGPKERRATLEGHHLASLPVVVVHEAYPGHHQQLCWANRSRSRVRKLADSAVLAEGWGLYCEELMYEQGFYETPHTRLAQLKDLVWRAARVVLDCRLHTGAIGFDEAVDFLVREAELERPNAIAEVKRYATSPTQPMSYAVGKQELLRLREEVRGRLGESFSLYDFHAAVLQAGTLPIGLVREEVLQRLELGVS